MARWWTESARTLGGMLTRPRPTLEDILAGRSGDVVAPVLLAVLTVVAAFPATVARYAWLWPVDPEMAVSKLWSRNGFIWSRLTYPGILVGMSAVCFFTFCRVVLRRRTDVRDALTAAAHLYVPMAALTLVGALLQRAGLGLPWLPHHPMDGWWVMEGGRVHVGRFYFKLVVEMTPPALVGLWWAWRTWRIRVAANAAGGA